MSNDLAHNPISPISLSAFARGLRKVPYLPKYGELTISGNGFEAISNPKPTAYDHFNEYSGYNHGDVLPKTGTGMWYNIGGPYGGYKLNTVEALPGREYCLESIGPKSWLEQPSSRVGGPTRDHNKIYASWYFKSNQKLGASNQIGSVSDKLIRIWGDGGGSDMRLSWLATHQGYAVNNRVQPYDNSAFTQENDSWHRLEVYIEDGQEAKHTFWIDGRKAGEIKDLDITSTHDGGNSTNILRDTTIPWGSNSIKGATVENLTDGSTGVIQNFSDINGSSIAITGLSGGVNNAFNTGDTYRIHSKVGHLGSPTEVPFFIHRVGYDPSYLENMNPDCRHYLADLHQQPSMARVELSNSPTFSDSSSQKRVYQNVSVRTDTSITIPEPFLCDLDPDNVYMHIIKSDGSVVDHGKIDVKPLSITGTIAQGSTISIAPRSSGFGAFGGEVIQYLRGDERPVGQPIDGTTALGSTPTVTTYVIGIGSDTTGTVLAYKDSITRPGRSQSLTLTNTDQGVIRAGGFGYNIGGKNDRDLYVSYNKKVESGVYDPLDININYKECYITGNGTAPGGFLEMPQFIFVGGAGDTSMRIANNTNTDGNVWNNKGWTIPETLSTWKRREFLLKMGTPGGSDGIAQVWLNRELGIDDTSWDQQPAVMDVVSTGYDSVRIGHMSRDMTDTIMAFTDYYVASTPARVELGNAPKWEDCTHTELQVVLDTDWTDQAISNVTLDKGALPDITGSYLYVIKSDNTPYDNIGYLL